MPVNFIRQSAIGIFATLAAILIGVCAGDFLNLYDLSRVPVGLALVAAGILGIVAIGRRIMAKRSLSAESFAGVGIVIYGIAVTIAEPFCIEGAPGALIAMVWLIPVIAMSIWLPRRGAWVSASGYWLILLTSIALIVFNAKSADAQVGFFVRMIVD
jgi:hypothetical protein